MVNGSDDGSSSWRKLPPAFYELKHESSLAGGEEFSNSRELVDAINQRFFSPSAAMSDVRQGCAATCRATVGCVGFSLLVGDTVIFCVALGVLGEPVASTLNSESWAAVDP